MSTKSVSETKMNKGRDCDRQAGGFSSLKAVVVLFLPLIIIGVVAFFLWGLGGRGLIGSISSERCFLPAVFISLVAAAVGSLILTLTWRYWPGYLAQGVLLAMVVRMFTTLAGIAFFSLFLGKLGIEFVFLIIGFYALGLISETIIALKISVECYES